MLSPTPGRSAVRTERATPRRGCRTLLRRVVPRVLLLLASLATLPQLAAAGGGDDAASLLVTVQLSAGGASREPRPLATEVHVVPVGDGSAPPVAAVRTGPDGSVSLTLPSGRYWVFVPPTDDVVQRFAARRPLPDGTPASGWAEVDLAPADLQTVTIVLRNLAP